MGKQSQLLLKPTEVELGLQVGVEFDNTRLPDEIFHHAMLANEIYHFIRLVYKIYYYTWLAYKIHH